MDPVSAIVAALSAGAALGAKELASTAAKDAYQGLKTLIVRRFGSVDVGMLERNPQSEGRQAAVEEELEAAGAAQAEDVIAAAKALLEKIQAEAPENAAGVGLQRVKAANVVINDVIASGSGVVARDLEASGDLSISALISRTTRFPD